jgi:hypothetical protein
MVLLDCVEADFTEPRVLAPADKRAVLAKGR